MTAHMHTESITATIINSTITIITSTISSIDIISPLIIWSTKLETYTRNITKPFALSPPPRLLEVVSPKAQYLSTLLSAHRRQNDQKIKTKFSSASNLTTPAQGSGFPQLKPCWSYPDRIPVQCSRGNVAEGIIVDETSTGEKSNKCSTWDDSRPTCNHSHFMSTHVSTLISHLKTHTGEKSNKWG